MKAVLYKFLVVGYTLAIATGAFSLLLISVQINHFADTHEESSRMKKQTTTSANDSFKIASGPYYKKIGYNETFNMRDLFLTTEQANTKIQITSTDYDLKKLGRTLVTVTFKNEAGNTATRLLILEVVDRTAPVLEAQDQQLHVGESFDAMKEATAHDEIDGDLTQNIKVSGTVDSDNEGTYHLQYEVSDTSHNTTKVEKTITFIQNETSTTAPSSITSETDKTIEEIPASQQPVVTAVSTPPQPVPAYQPSTLSIAGSQVSYQNGGQGSGQAIIDNNPSGLASTWGGAPIQSGNDGLNTHFIGHSPGIFSVLFSIVIGTPIIVTDAAGTPTTYIVNNILHVDDSGIELGTETDYWETSVGTGGGERITLQTCISETENLMVLASVS